MAIFMIVLFVGFHILPILFAWFYCKVFRTPASYVWILISAIPILIASYLTYYGLTCGSGCFSGIFFMISVIPTAILVLIDSFILFRNLDVIKEKFPKISSTALTIIAILVSIVILAPAISNVVLIIVLTIFKTVGMININPMGTTIVTLLISFIAFFFGLQYCLKLIKEKIPNFDAPMTFKVIALIVSGYYLISLGHSVYTYLHMPIISNNLFQKLNITNIGSQCIFWILTLFCVYRFLHLRREL